MTNAPHHPAPDQQTPHVGLPGIATALFIVSPLTVLLGGLIVLGASYADYFERSPNQAALGTVVLLIGVILLATAIVLAGVRSIAQRQLNILFHTRVDRQE